LDEGKTYKARIYKDAADAHFKNNPTAIDFDEIEIKKGMSQTFDLVPGGGFAISLLVE
jgi:hypothetical protein